MCNCKSKEMPGLHTGKVSSAVGCYQGISSIVQLGRTAEGVWISWEQHSLPGLQGGRDVGMQGSRDMRMLGCWDAGI